MQQNVIVAVFPSRSILIKALDYIQELDLVDLEHASVVMKSEDGRVVFMDDNLGAAEGGLLGSGLGSLLMLGGVGLLGAFSLPTLYMVLTLLVAIGIGAGIGNLVGRFVAGSLTINLNFKTDDANRAINAIGDRLQSGHHALLLTVKDTAALLPRLRDDLRGYRAELVMPLFDALAKASDEA